MANIRQNLEIWIAANIHRPCSILDMHYHAFCSSPFSLSLIPAASSTHSVTPLQQKLKQPIKHLFVNSNPLGHVRADSKTSQWTWQQCILRRPPPRPACILHCGCPRWQTRLGTTSTWSRRRSRRRSRPSRPGPGKSP